MSFVQSLVLALVFGRQIRGLRPKRHAVTVRRQGPRKWDEQGSANQGSEPAARRMPSIDLAAIVPSIPVCKATLVQLGWSCQKPFCSPSSALPPVAASAKSACCMHVVTLAPAGTQASRRRDQSWMQSLALRGVASPAFCLPLLAPRWALRSEAPSSVPG